MSEYFYFHIINFNCGEELCTGLRELKIGPTTTIQGG